MTETAPRLDLPRLLKAAVDNHASDIHLKAGCYPVFRIDGDLHELSKHNRLTPQDLTMIAKTVMDERQIEIFKQKHEVDLAYSLSGVGRFRVNVFQQRGSIAIALRIIPIAVKTFPDLNLPAVLEKICQERRGMVLVTGATGSGKSTTLAAMIDYINAQRTCHIITIEDPIEFLLRDQKSFINQREVGFDTVNFLSALRAAFRQDPDVILVGEMRDYETISTALLAAETGHLVLSTLHTTDVLETINRILAVFPSNQQDLVRFQLASVLKSIVCQRLLPRADGQGRVPAVEVMIGTARVYECIKEKTKTEQLPDVMMQGHTSYGMQTFDMSLLGLLRSNLITVQDALDNATNPADFRLRLQGISGLEEAVMSEFKDSQDKESKDKKKGPGEGGKGGSGPGFGNLIERFSE